MSGKPYIRLLRDTDFALIKSIHNDLFQFDYDEAQFASAGMMSSSRWLCLGAAVQPAAGPEELAGFVLAAVGSKAEFEQGVYTQDGASAVDSNGKGESGGTDAGSGQPSSSQRQSLGLEQLPDSEDTNPDSALLVNVCLLGVLPQYQRRGIASMLMSQVMNTARSVRSKGVFLHVLDSNQGAQDFYKKLGFQQVGRVPNFYTVTAAEPGKEPSTQYKDALLLHQAVGGGSTIGAPPADTLLGASGIASYRAARQAAAQRRAAAGAKAAPPKMRGLSMDSLESATPKAAPPPKMKGLGLGDLDTATPKAASPPPKMRGLGLGSLDGPSPSTSSKTGGASAADGQSMSQPTAPPSAAAPTAPASPSSSTSAASGVTESGGPGTGARSESGPSSSSSGNSSSSPLGALAGKIGALFSGKGSGNQGNQSDRSTSEDGAREPNGVDGSGSSGSSKSRDVRTRAVPLHHRVHSRCTSSVMEGGVRHSPMCSQLVRTPLVRGAVSRGAGPRVLRGASACTRVRGCAGASVCSRVSHSRVLRV